MRNLLPALLCLVFVACEARAAVGWNVPTADDEGGTDHSADFSRLDYYPHAGHFLIMPELTSSLNDQSASSVNGQSTSSSGTLFTQATLTVTYGVAPRLRIGLADTELFASNTSRTSSNGETFTRTSGPSDFTATAAYRFFERESGFASDLGISVSPSLLSHDIASAAQDGTNGRGYGTLEAGVPLYQWFGRNELELEPELTYDFSGAETAATVKNSFNRGSVWTGSVILSDRFHVCSDVYVQFTGQLAFAYSYVDNYLDGKTVRTIQQPTNFIPTLLIGYRMARNAKLELIYLYQNYVTHTVETSTASHLIEDTLSARFAVEL